MHRRVVVVSQAAHRAAHVRRVISHQIAAQSQQRLRNTRTLLLLLADRFICDLHDGLIRELGIVTDARRVMLSAERLRHILQRRQVVSQIDADLAAHRISEALAGARFVRVPQRRPDVFELIGQVASADRHLLVALKLVRSSRTKTGHDEWWIQTSHPVGREKLRKLEASTQVRILLAAV
jgi:hypothetical protein